jgi:hypothetical protein
MGRGLRQGREASAPFGYRELFRTYARVSGDISLSFHRLRRQEIRIRSKVHGAVTSEAADKGAHRQRLKHDTIEVRMV